MREKLIRAKLFLGAAVLAAAVLISTPLTASAEDGSSPEKSRPVGGVEFKVPQSPEQMLLPIGYIREMLDHPRPASRLDVDPEDIGVAGAIMGVEENNAGGRFTGHLYKLAVETASSPEKALAALEKLHESGHNYIIVDASAPTLLKLSDWAKDKDVLLFNVRATDVSLRQEDCRANIMHIVPDRYMLTDALAQYLVAMGWENWLIVHEVVVEVQRKPTSNVMSDTQSENISIQIASDDQIWIKGRRVDPRSVRANISRLKAENPKAAVIIKANNKSTVSPVAKVIDSAREAGIYNVSLSTGE